MEWSSTADYLHAVCLNESAEGHRNSVHIQGKKVTFRKQKKRSDKQSPGKKEAITTFSASSRRKLLDWIARIDWDYHRKGQFITLTYPDDCANVDLDRATDQRNYLIQAAERKLGVKFPTLWRKEYVPRKSGKYTRIYVHHFHVCMFAPCAIDVAQIKEWWKKAIRYPWNVQVHQIQMSGQHAAFYMAKYLIKKDEPEGILEDVSYLNKPGRAWGWRRDELLHLMPVESFVGITDEQYERMMEQTLWMCPKACEWGQESFTLYGRKADEAAEIIREIMY